MDIPNNYLICDIRTSKELNGGTISGYKKRDTINIFQNSIINNKIEEALYWGVELHVSTYDKEIWNSIHDIYKKYIHINNPKLFFYIIQRENEYNNIILNYPKKHYIFSRNNQEIRNLFCDLISILTLSKKNNLFLDKSLPKVNLNKITKDELKNRVLNNNYNIIQDLGYDSLNNTEILCINQIFHNLNNHQGTLNNCFYWYILLEKSWKSKKSKNINNINDINNTNNIDNYIKSNNLNKNSILNYTSNNTNNNWTEIIWQMIEKILMNSEKNNLLIKKLKIYYNIHFKESKISNLKYIFFIVFFIVKQNINWSIPLINKYNIYIQCCANINQLYMKTSNNVFIKLDKLDQEIYIKKFYEMKNKMINNVSNEIEKKHVENNNINLNKIIQGNPLTNEYTNYDIHDDTSKINKNKTMKDIDEAKEEKIDKKMEFFNKMITKKNNNINNNIKYNKINDNNINDKEYIRELFITKKSKK